MDPIGITLVCDDGVALGGHWWRVPAGQRIGTVIVNCATGVLSRYYHRYAAFLAVHGFDALTYDYRGIGPSRPANLKSVNWTWRHWGELDFEAAMVHALSRASGAQVHVVGHSIGGFLPGYAGSAPQLASMLTVGAQYAYWRDYRAGRKFGQFMKWHVAMPAITSLWGYFPGRRLGWLEDLPRGVVDSWSFGSRRIEDRLPPSDRRRILDRFAAVTAPILAVGVSDDVFATHAAMTRSLDYYSGAKATKVMLHPTDLDRESVGHFDLLHARHESGFWLDTLLWLRDGINPWPHRRFD
jgi:predicted alpha/beta hydrolase